MTYPYSPDQGSGCGGGSREAEIGRPALGLRRGRLWLSTLYQLWRYENYLPAGEVHDGYDAVYMPIHAHTTGEVDIHDVHERRTAC